MSSEALYEQYKDALKRGHVASLRGRVDEALLAYAEAARIAPERSTPHSSAGNALLRRKRAAEALRHYEVALTIAPRDEAALLGRAQALAALDRRGDAADAFDALADSQAGSGRLADAVDAARRGLEMAEGRERRRTLERLISRLRASEPDEPGRLALEHALLVLEGPAVPRAKAGHRPAATPKRAEPTDASSATGHAATMPEAAPVGEAPEAAAEPGALSSTPISEGSDAVAAMPEAVATEASSGGGDEEVLASETAGHAPEAVEDVAESELAAVQPEPEPEPEAAPADVRIDTEAGEAIPQAETTPAGRTPRRVPADATVEGLSARAEEAADAHEPGRALEAMLDLATLHARDGRIEAALDTCYAALSLDPDSVALHLALADLYTERGWDNLANEKLDLLDRLARLDADEGAMEEIAAARADRG